MCMIIRTRRSCSRHVLDGHWRHFTKNLLTAVALRSPGNVPGRRPTYFSTAGIFVATGAAAELHGSIYAVGGLPGATTRLRLGGGNVPKSSKVSKFSN